MSKTLKFLAFSCTHAPKQCDETIEWLVDQVKDVKPDLIVSLGDLYEMDSASRWPSEYTWSLSDEYREADVILKRLRQTAPASCQTVFIPGNHDDNCLAVGRLNPKIRDLCDWRNRQYDSSGKWCNEERITKWRQVCQYEYGSPGVYYRGQLAFYHGYEAGVAGDRNQAMNLAKMPHSLCISGHTHKAKHPQPALERYNCSFTPWFANAGCTTKLKPGYVSRKNTFNWTNACVVGDFQDIKSPRMSRCWSAETRIFRRYGDL